VKSKGLPDRVLGPAIKAGRNGLLLGLFGILLAAGTALAGGKVYFTTPAVLKSFFPDSKKVSYVRLDLKGPAKKSVKDALGYVPAKESYVIFVAKTGPRVDGYAIIDEEKGQHEPITFAIRLSPEGRVTRSEVMVYREGQGDGIRSARFRKQFEGRGPSATLRVGTDVVAVSGATISSKSMAAAIRRAIVLVAEHKKAQPAQKLASRGH
jgi:Na+-translocating ferredoxin:NAD+ oxidoreductase RnfG subunit